MVSIAAIVFFFITSLAQESMPDDWTKVQKEMGWNDRIVKANDK